MKLVIRSVVFHSICILLFSILYFYIRDEFTSLNHSASANSNTYIDFLLLSTTVQSGVGISDLIPAKSFSKICLIAQQYIMLMTHVITLYIFTL